MVIARCPKCGYEFRAEGLVRCPQCFCQFSTAEKYFVPRKKSSKPTVAGVLLITIFVLTLFAAVALFSAPSLLEHYPTGQKSFVYGRVIEESNKGVENASVKILGSSTKTNSTGYYRIENIDLGVHKIKISKEGKNTIIAKIFVWGQAEDFKLTSGNSTTEEDRTKELFAIIYACATIQIIFLAFILLAAIFAIKRKHFGICIVGSVLGIMSMFVIVSTILSVLALILIILSKDEFEK